MVHACTYMWRARCAEMNDTTHTRMGARMSKPGGHGTPMLMEVSCLDVYPRPSQGITKSRLETGCWRATRMLA